MLEAAYNMLKEHDKAFVDGFLCAIKYLEERGDIIYHEAQLKYLHERLNDLIQGTLESYEDD